MRPSLRLLLLLILSIALRGFSGMALAQPQTLHAVFAEAATSMADCPEHQDATATPLATHHQPGDKACQISCDLAAAPALLSSLSVPAGPLPATLHPTRPILTVSEAPPPDHPPPIC